MDPVSQGVLGASASLAVFGARRRLGAWALPIGLVAGMAADLDVVLPYFVDLALPWQYHRHFTHALAFIPIGAAFCAAIFMLVPSLRARWRSVFVASGLAYATHGLLDACTSYGTHLYWPFDPRRVSWDVLPIVDPVLTLLMLALVILATWRRARAPAWIALSIFAAWVSFGWVQRERARELQVALAASRKHEVEHARVMPMPLSLFLWRSVYRAGGRMHADTLRLAPLRRPTWRSGGQLLVDRPILRVPAGAEHANKRELLALYDDFADSLTGRVPGRARVIGDMRFVAGFGFEALWGLKPGVRADASDLRFVSAWPASAPPRSKLLRSLVDVIVSGGDFEDFPVELLAR